MDAHIQLSPKTTESIREEIIAKKTENDKIPSTLNPYEQWIKATETNILMYKGFVE